MLIDRTIISDFRMACEEKGVVIILYGPRQAGKTTLLKMVFPQDSDALKFNGDDLFTQKTLGTNDFQALKSIVGSAETIIIDEAQRIPNIGLVLKLLVDNLQASIIASGSASFELADKINEPLTGRTKTFLLFPLSFAEVSSHYLQTLPETALEEMLVFGMYPKIHTLGSNLEKQEYLIEYVNNYLYRDILAFEGIKKPQKVIDLLALLALQVGKEVPIAELAAKLSISQKSVESYLNALEKMFVIKNLRGFSRNLRKEISKTSKYYFADAGVRNAILRNFNPLRLRDDAGMLFENWFVIEKIKQSENSRQPANYYFWRTYDGKEIDLIEERQGMLEAFECKFSALSREKIPKEFLKAYKNSTFKTITQKNAFEELNEN